MKLECDIRLDLFNYIKGSSLIKEVNGLLYKQDEERPDNADSEDIVIAVLTEPNINDVQEIIVLVRIYVADLFDSKSNLYRIDGRRIAKLEKLSFKEFEVFRTKESRCSLISQKTFKVQGRNEHCIVNRISYKHCNY